MQSERDRAERVQLESELASMREAVEHASRDASEREKSEVDKLERELASLKEEHEDAQKKEQLDRKNTEHEETAAKIQELEQQIVTMSERDDVTEPSSDSSEANKARILELEQHLLEKDSELVDLQESLRLAKEAQLR
ncbi:hypothetical protein E3U43_020749 [Larimichthys crocea]|uniref:Uncharacterized protein n=1 Tax=Larimichthys crocea TaxID=215358 RepID=A0ACD3Q743_LARCR|nr:hypothetical protein E3U43_020749 [Larimichthys crocea]